MFLTAAEARKRLGVSRETLRKAIKSGALVAHKSGGGRNSHYRIAEADLADYLRRQTIKAAQ